MPWYGSSQGKNRKRRDQADLAGPRSRSGPRHRARRRVATSLITVMALVFTALALGVAGAGVTGAPAAAQISGVVSKATEPGFSGWVLSNGRQLGIATLKNGTKGICFDAGGKAWPSSTVTPATVTNPKVGYLLALWMGKAASNSTIAAALWTVVGLDLGQNSNTSYMSASINDFHAEFPGAWASFSSYRSQMKSDAADYAPPSGGYNPASAGLRFYPKGTTGAGAVGAVVNIGVKSAAGKFVPGATITLTLSGGATWDRNGKTEVTVTSSTSAQTLNYTATGTGTLKVTEKITGLGNPQFKRQPAINGSQRVGFSAGTTTVTETASLNPGYVRVRKVDGTTGAALVGATFTVWWDLNNNGKLDTGEPSGSYKSGSGGYTATLSRYAGARLCAKETAAPAGYAVQSGVACAVETATSTAAAPVTITYKDYAQPVNIKYPLTVTKTTDDSDPGDPAGMIGVTVEVRQGSATGTVISNQYVHTFTAADIKDGVASWTTPAQFDEDTDYWVVIIHEPDGFRPQQTAVQAVLSTDAGGDPVGFTVGLVDDKIWTPVLSTQISTQSAEVGSTITDTVHVTSTGGHSVTGSWQLLGPIQPSSAGFCPGTGKAWDKAPIAAQGTFAIDGDGDYTVGAYKVTRSGCYTYREATAAGDDGDTVATEWTPAGLPAETALVKAAPSVTTRVQHKILTAPAAGTTGPKLADIVTVKGTSGATVKVAWAAYGPVAARKTKSGKYVCSGLSDAAWSKARLLAHGTVSVTGDGTHTIGAFTLNASDAGCVGYTEKILAGPANDDYGWTRLGETSETAVVRPHQPVTPHHVETGHAGIDPTRVQRRTVVANPVVKIKAVGLKTTLLATGLTTTGDLIPPGDNPSQGGWWSAAAPFSAVAGTTVVFGHVSDAQNHPESFGRLNKAAKGQIVTLKAGGRTTRWRITSVTTNDRNHLPASPFKQGLARKLVLITCTHEVVSGGGHFHYTRNRIVTAVPLR